MKHEVVVDAALATAPILLEHLHWHWMGEAPNHLDWSLGFKAHQAGAAEKRIWGGNAVHFLARASEEQHRVAPVFMVDQVLPLAARLACLRLGLPVQQLSAYGIVLIHRAGRKFLLGLLERDQSRDGLNPGKVKDPDSCDAC